MAWYAWFCLTWRFSHFSNRKENVDRDITIERCGLYRSLGLEDPAVMYASILKRVDDYAQMSAEVSVALII